MLIIGIAGGTGSGKTTVVRKIIESLPAGQTAVTAPMPGNILRIEVSQGQHVEEGDVIMILEAMKMENEIVATKSGTIAQIAVSKGAVVETGTVLAVIA